MLTDLPTYVHLARAERGESFALSFTDYRFLCRHSLAILHQVSDGTMAIQKLAGGGACVDIWHRNGCHSIEVNSSTGTLRLYFADDLDSSTIPVLLWEGDISAASWSSLQDTALAYR